MAIFDCLTDHLVQGSWKPKRSTETTGLKLISRMKVKIHMCDIVLVACASPHCSAVIIPQQYHLGLRYYSLNDKQNVLRQLGFYKNVSTLHNKL